MSLDTKQLELIRDHSFNLAQSEKEVWKAKNHFKLAFSIEEYLKATTIRTRPVIQDPFPQESKVVQKA